MALQIVKLNDRPRQSDPHIQADYIELLCLVSLDKAISKADILGDYQAEADLDMNLAAEDESTDTEPAAVSDRRLQRINELFEQFIFRSVAFGEFYPFEITGNQSVLKLRDQTSQVSQKQMLYIFLLVASSLRVFDKATEQIITSSFEAVSLSALKSYLPSNARVKLFGKSSLEKQEQAPTKLIEKIRKLAEEIRETLAVDLEKEFKKSNTGDGGLDIVGWLPIGDEAPGFILLFGQCACTLDWVTKQHSSSYDTWRNIINFTVPPNNIVFIPFCFRDAGGVWLRKIDIHSSILFDRLRIVNLLRMQDGALENLPNSIVEEVLNTNKPLSDLQ